VGIGEGTMTENTQTPNLISRFAAAKESLCEARRYVMSHPDAAKRLAKSTTTDLGNLTWSIAYDYYLLSSIVRLINNIDVATRGPMLAVSPDAARGYIDGVIYELSSMIFAEQNRASAPGRDAELMEGYGGRKQGP
jgi:hypothetical protein